MNSKMLVSNIDDFMAHYGPSPDHIPTPAVVRSCKEFLLQHGILSRRVAYGEENWSWTKFPEPPSQTNKPEKEVYEPFVDVVEKTWEYAGDSRNHQYCFEMVDSDKILGNSQAANHNINAHIIESTYQETLSKTETILPVKFNTTATWSTEEKHEMRGRIIDDCKHIMRDDPRRKFIYGVTIEDDRCLLWYFCRTYHVRALAFKFMSGKGIDRFISIMLRFAYATPSDLGLDPQVHKADRQMTDDEQRWIYEFDVDKDFTTGRPHARGIVSSYTQNELGKQGSDVLNDDKKAESREADGEEDGKDDHNNTTPPPRSADFLPCSTPTDRKRKAFFRTIRLICLGGRLTRIWEVIEVTSLHDLKPVSGARPVILKDVWVDANSKTEGENTELIFDAVEQLVADGLKANPGPDGMMRFLNKEPRFKDFNERTKARLAKLLTGNKYRELFLTKLLEWEGDRSKPAKGSCLPEPLFKVGSTTGNEGSSSLATTSKMSTHVDMMEDPDRSSVPQPPELVARREYDQKKQVRIVYEEVCKEVSSLRTYGEAMDVVRQALDALQILYCAGWIHRDISIGNILACRVKNAGEITWQVKLADLEFSRPSGHTTHSSDPRTGTPQFIPVEISDSQHIAYTFLTVDALSTKMYTLAGLPPPEPAESTLATRFLAKGHADYDHYAQFQPTTPGFEMHEKLPIVNVHGSIPADVVSHNYQHDLESLWWIMLYFVIGLSDNPKSTAFADKIFTRKPVGHTRHMTLRETLVPTNFAIPLFRVFYKRLETLRKLLYEEYVVRAVCGAMGTPDAYSLIHGKFAEQLDELLDTNTDNWKAIRMVRKDRAGNKIESSLDQASFESTKRGFEDLQDPQVSSTLQRLKKVRIE